MDNFALIAYRIAPTGDAVMLARHSHPHRRGGSVKKAPKKAAGKAHKHSPKAKAHGPAKKPIKTGASKPKAVKKAPATPKPTPATPVVIDLTPYVRYKETPDIRHSPILNLFDQYKRYFIMKSQIACFYEPPEESRVDESTKKQIEQFCAPFRNTEKQIKQNKEELDKLMGLLGEYKAHVELVRHALVKEAKNVLDPTFNFMAFAVAVIFRESSFIPTKVSPAGAKGLMQIMDETGLGILQKMDQDLIFSLGIAPYDVIFKDVETSRMLEDCFRTRQPNKETLDYIQTIMTRMDIKDEETLIKFNILKDSVAIFENVKKLARSPKNKQEALELRKQMKTLTNQFYADSKALLAAKDTGLIDRLKAHAMDLIGHSEMIFDPASNVAMGIYYLAYIFEKYSHAPYNFTGDELKTVVLAAYNIGPPKADSVLYGKISYQKAFPVTPLKKGAKPVLNRSIPEFFNRLPSKTKQYALEIIRGHKGLINPKILDKAPKVTVKTDEIDRHRVKELLDKLF
jgi:hypothetical protein